MQQASLDRLKRAVNSDCGARVSFFKDEFDESDFGLFTVDYYYTHKFEIQESGEFVIVSFRRLYKRSPFVLDLVDMMLAGNYEYTYKLAAMNAIHEECSGDCAGMVPDKDTLTQIEHAVGYFNDLKNDYRACAKHDDEARTVTVRVRKVGTL